MKKIIYKVTLCLILSLLTLSCGKWVDIKPTDRLAEDQLFVNKEGYMKALNGIYVEMTNASLYGENMTAGAIDIMAQYYYMSGTTHKFFKYTTFVYTDEIVKSTFNNAWRKAYELIANCNVILEKCGDAPSANLPQPYYGIIKGEVLALRAMLHFDMLRVFGPIYTPDNKSKPAIPYVNETGFEIFPLLGSEQVMEKVTGDLKNAMSLLADTDPIRTSGVRNGNNSAGSNDLYYRQYRLNYYAAKALLARAYLWQANTADALIQAEELLLEVQNPSKIIFPNVTFAAATDAVKPDRTFSTEVMFSLYDINRVKMYQRLFDVSLLPINKLTINGTELSRAREVTFYDATNADYRRRIWQDISTGTATGTTNLKYSDVVDGPGRYMIPLIRLSEVLLIAAECHPDLATRIAYLNKVRSARNIADKTPVPTTPALVKEAILSEFRREVFGEGQQFFFYKRNAYLSIPNHATIAGTPPKAITLNLYTVPLPDSEISQRN